MLEKQLQEEERAPQLKARASPPHLLRGAGPERGLGGSEVGEVGEPGHGEAGGLRRGNPRTSWTPRSLAAPQVWAVVWGEEVRLLNPCLLSTKRKQSLFVAF